MRDGITGMRNSNEFTTYKFTRRLLYMMRQVNLLNNGNANLLVPKSEVLSAEATLMSLITLASTISLRRSSARSK